MSVAMKRICDNTSRIFRNYILSHVDVFTVITIIQWQFVKHYSYTNYQHLLNVYIVLINVK